MGSVKTRGEQRTRETARRQPPPRGKARRQLEQLSGRARERMLERLDDQRDAFVRALEDTAHGLERATGRNPSSLTQRMLETGGRALRGASTHLGGHSAEELLAQAGRQVRQRPGWWMTGLLGAGLLAGRVLRASGVVEASEEET
ncbi:hypothetical protein LY474_35665 [Myxococcus stipitatus]|uniref:hypothetical protein n=1 Tax=Myxococcus stipitatus TaxID=83455 RepID=UPI001F2D870E|nr:hypothetical protein [Myxococcus stipitatus]MCE9673158.1 hypothetical protein [Myxococcus stipitatus]